MLALEIKFSSRAMLGPMARDFDPKGEAESIANEISQQLKETDVELGNGTTRLPS